MKKPKNLLLILSLFLCHTVLAQTRTIKGVIRTQSGPLEGASVIIKETNKGSSSDRNGSFSLNAPNKPVTLVFSHIGFTSIEKFVGENENSVEILFAAEGNSLSEVVVTSLGISRQAKSLVYAKQTVNAESLTGVRDANNVVNSLQGKVANAIITQGSGGPGSGARIVLRGNRSIQKSNNALIVIDGVPIINGSNRSISNDFNTYQGSDGASSINPDDIESITVLPGAAAAALYGSDGGNGAIVITTKKGSKDRVSVTLNSGISVDKVFSLPEFQNIYGQGNGGNLSPTSGQSWGAKMTGQSYTNYLGEQSQYSPQPDNVRDFFRTGVSLNNYVGISGGSDKMQTYFSYTNNNIQGVVPRNDLERHTINLRITNQISRKFSTDAKITYLIQDIKRRPGTGEGDVVVMDVYQTPRNLTDANSRQYQTIGSTGVPERTFWPSPLTSMYLNPYWALNNTIYNESRNRASGFISAKYQILDWLSITGRANLDRLNDRIDEKYFQGTDADADEGGHYIKRNYLSQQKWFDAILSGHNSINKNIKAEYNIGATYQVSDGSSVVDEAKGLNIPNRFSLNFAKNSSFYEGSSTTKTQSVFGQVNISFKNSIFVDGSLRNEWQSTLPAPYSFMYYAAGISAIVSDLVTLPQFVSYLKANLNYAQVGNGGEFGLLDPVFYYSPGGSGGFLYRGSTFPIPDLKPELVKSFESSIEAKFFNNRVGFTATYYKALSTNQLLEIELPPATGYASQYINAGEIQNSGIELIVNASPMKHKTFNWDIAFNFSNNKNRVNRLSEDVKRVVLTSGYVRAGIPVVQEGGSFGDLLAYQWARGTKGEYLVTDNGRPLTTDVQGKEPGVIGNFNPKYNLGLTNSFNYKKLFLSFLIDGRIGGTIISGTEMNLAYSGITQPTEKYREGGWVLKGVNPGGQPVSTPITSQEFWQTVSGKRYGVGEFFAYHATNFRLREVSIGYDLPLWKKAFIKSARLSLSGRNLFWLARGKSLLDIPGLGKRKMWFDPDMSLSSNNYQGIEYGNMPSTRSFALNLKLDF